MSHTSVLKGVSEERARSRWLLRFGGLLNAAGALFHVFLAHVVHVSNEIDQSTGALIQALNLATFLLIAFMAFASFAYRRELLETRLGRSVLVLVILLYGTRGIEEVVLFNGSPVFLGYCALLVAIYLLVLIGARRLSESNP